MRATAFSEFGLLAVLLIAGCTAAPPPSANEGRALYEANGCASCHGRYGRGDGPAASKLPSRPIALDDESLFKRGATEDAIAATLAVGIPGDPSTPELHHTHHELVMPKFDHLTDNERHSIALYVISLRAGADHERGQP
jgi:mono/diheme cytochrome c family protein